MEDYQAGGDTDFGRIWWTKISKDGNFIRQFGASSWDVVNKDDISSKREVKITQNGKAWVKGDYFILQYQGYLDGLKVYTTMFKNPEGTPKNKDEYYYLTDGAVHPFSLVKKSF